MQVDIFLTISAKTTGKIKQGNYKYMLICGSCTKEWEGELRNTTGNRLALACCIEALGHMTKPSMITIHTDWRYLLNNHLQEWKDKGWKRPTGKLKNADLWQQLYDLQKPHAIRWHYENMDIYR